MTLINLKIRIDGFFMSVIIALFNQSGGVGKTTLTQNLGYHLAVRQHKVLLVDMDSQASLTTFMGLDPNQLEKTVYHAVVGEKPLPIHDDIYHMALVPSNVDLSAAEMELVSVLMRELRLKNVIEPLLPKYDFILIDCPPSLGILSILGLVAATHVLVPVQCQFKSFQGTDLLLRTLTKIKKAANPHLILGGFVPMMYDIRNNQDGQIYRAMQQQLSPVGTVFNPVPNATAFANASLQRQPLAVYAPTHRAVIPLEQIVDNLEKLGA
nr:AAA family ATPase [Gloeothece citriformis]